MSGSSLYFIFYYIFINVSAIYPTPMRWEENFDLCGRKKAYSQRFHDSITYLPIKINRKKKPRYQSNVSMYIRLDKPQKQMSSPLLQAGCGNNNALIVNYITKSGQFFDVEQLFSGAKTNRESIENMKLTLINTRFLDPESLVTLFLPTILRFPKILNYLLHYHYYYNMQYDFLDTSSRLPVTLDYFKLRRSRH